MVMGVLGHVLVWDGGWELNIHTLGILKFIHVAATHYAKSGFYFY